MNKLCNGTVCKSIACLSALLRDRHSDGSFVDWELMSQGNPGYERRRRVRLAAKFDARGFRNVPQNIDTWRPQLSASHGGWACEQCAHHQHCWHPRPGIEPASLSSAGQHTTNWVIEAGVWKEIPMFSGKRCVIAPLVFGRVCCLRFYVIDEINEIDICWSTVLCPELLNSCRVFAHCSMYVMICQL